ncbi:VOC family protein [Aurantivibrio plasticivorans]
MIGYVTVGTNDREKSAAYFDELLALIGGKQFFGNDHMTFWGVEPGKPLLGVGAPFNGEPASVGNGMMVSLSLKDKEAVDAFYQKALALGGSDEGEPGMRTDTFYGAYFRDLDGNKFCAFCMV